MIMCFSNTDKIYEIMLFRFRDVLNNRKTFKTEKTSLTCTYDTHTSIDI